ncbi:cytochrome P450 [Solimonas terrae]|uniref:Cytochrome P450 n=1 Tax=Solimonas terrae TaxID=1396819 RepID=A0A6M2BQK2_9GAMM|nr:cytochrome P450 [Solimonas terrae]NGY04357.1 cytochrome P450 [Solimonas terrae]
MGNTASIIEMLSSPEFIENPYPAFAQIRQQEPVCFLEPFNAWLLTRFEDVQTAFTDDRFLFQYEKNQINRLGPRAVEQDYFRIGREFLVVTDPPRHTQLKRIFSQPFTPRRVAELADSTKALVDSTIDRFVEKGRVDIVSEFSHRVPLAIISRLLGIDSSYEEQILGWVSAFYAILFVSPMSDEELGKANATAAEARDFFLASIRRRRANPGDDFISDLIVVNDQDDEPLSDEQIAINAFLLYFAGHDTQQSQFSLLIDTLDRNPDALAYLRDHPEQIRQAAPELYRYDATGMFMPRTVAEDLVLNGRSLKKGQNLMCSMTAANRDPEAFEDPDRLKFDRRPVSSGGLRNMSFGAGRHRCLGANLAQANLPIMLAGVLDRLKNLRVEWAGAQRLPTFEVRGFAHLPLSWDL